MRSSTATPVIQLDGVGVVRDGRSVLRDVSVDILTGEFVGVIGPNGAGKSTLLGVICGLVCPAAGRVRVLGLNPADWREGIQARRRIGLVAQIQRFNPLAPILVGESVLLGRAGLRGLGRRFSRSDREVARRAMADTGVEKLAERPLGTLSGGELQRVAIARALAQEPEILLLDEPTASVDPAARQDLVNLLARLPRLTGAAIVCVTHDPWMLPAACERVLMLKHGRLLRGGPRARMLAAELLEELYAEEGSSFVLSVMSGASDCYGRSEGSPS